MAESSPGRRRRRARTFEAREGAADHGPAPARPDRARSRRLRGRPHLLHATPSAALARRFRAPCAARALVLRVERTAGGGLEMGTRSRRGLLLHGWGGHSGQLTSFVPPS